MSTISNRFAEQFGADVRTASEGRAMCMVIGHISPVSAISAAGGTLVAMLPNHRAIAIVDLRSLPILQGNADIRVAGPISVDPQRFAAFQRLVGARG